MCQLFFSVAFRILLISPVNKSDTMCQLIFLNIRIRITFQFIAIFHRATSNKIPRIVSSPKFSRYFYTLLILNVQIQNNHCASKQISRINNKSQLLMKYHLVTTLYYPKSASTSLEQVIQNQTTQMVMSKHFAGIICNYWS